VLEETRTAIGLRRGAVAVDVTDFEQLVASGTSEALARAADLYKGDLLAGVEVRSDPFAEWLGPERARLREKALVALDTLLSAQRRATPAAAAETARRLLVLDPVRESAHHALMELYADEGRLGDAIRQYEACVERLRRMLGVDPSPAMRSVYHTLLERHGTATPGTASPIAHATTALVGRTAELERLARALTAALAGQGRLVEVVGEAGIGKSRLVAELAAQASAMGVRVIVGHCRDHEQVLPLRPWMGMLDALVQAPEIRRHVDDPVRLFEAALEHIQHLATSSPLLLVLEDAHWADDTSVRLLSFLCRRLAGVPVLIVVTVRAEEFVDTSLLARLFTSLSRDDVLVRVTLGVLSHADTLALVGTLASPALAIERMGERVWAFSRGHPLITVEAVRAVEDGVRVHEPADEAAPARVREVIASRLARLGERSRQLVSVAAVIGRPFEFRLLQRAGGLTEPETAVAVEELSRRLVLTAVGDLLDFSHEQLRDVAYAGILPPVRKALHASVAATIERHAAGALEAHWASLALHHRESEAWEAAARCFQHAGRQAATRAAHREAVECFEQALTALNRLAPAPDTRVAAIDLRFDLRNSLVPLGIGEPVDARLAEAHAMAEELGDRGRLGWIASYTAFQLNLGGDYHAAVDASRRAVAAAGEADAKLAVHANYCLVIASYSLGDFRRAVDAGRAAVERLGDPHQQGGGATLPGIVCRAYAAFNLAELGQFDEARTLAEDAVRIAVLADHRYSAAVAGYGMGMVEALQGDVAAALPDFERALGLCRAGEFDVLEPFIAAGLGIATARSGRVDDGIRLLDEAVARNAARGHHLWGEQREQWLAEALLLGGRLDEADAHARRALALARERGARGVEAWTLRLLGDVTGAREGDAAAAPWRREALALATTLGMRPLQALIGAP
jgi:DNA-binding SARP family transcriptional activator